MKVYNICNDMSLTNANKMPAGYRWVKREIVIKGQAIIVELGFDLKHKELHYLRSETELNLEGERL